MGEEGGGLRRLGWGIWRKEQQRGDGEAREIWGGRGGRGWGGREGEREARRRRRSCQPAPSLSQKLVAMEEG
ncbi:hypothetical protein C1H46_036848 [Malus baccata]|uniref:Uncharacterized protein n=1 Tax=Malus baccata TaxID=106549 RepID=A0A540KU35_MALBA|nr:hypothetical protein C1H46_036848 [Malus baccata]